MTIEAVRRLVESAAVFELPTESPPDAARAFELVPIADLGRFAPAPTAFAWGDSPDGLVPMCAVTLVTGHGGVGKSTGFALQLAVCAAAGLSMLGLPTSRLRVCFYSAEDGAETLRRALHRVCRGLGVDPATLDGWLFLLDATQGDPALFHEITVGGRRQGSTTPAYAELAAFLDEHGIGLVIIDNASDCLDASEIDRARVRGFMRALARLAIDRDRAVILLAHVDKGTSRGERSGTESYTGSTAWHNSARSRLYLSRDKDGGLLLEHQKSNLGRLHEPMRIEWPEGGILQPEHVQDAAVQRIDDRNQMRAVLRLIAEFTERGEHVSTLPTSRVHAGKLLRGQPGFPPKLADPELFELLRTAERRGLLARSSMRSKGRGHEKEVWTVTPAGRADAGIAPSAPSAPTPAFGALGAAGPEGAPSAPTSASGGTGEAGGVH